MVQNNKMVLFMVFKMMDASRDDFAITRIFVSSEFVAVIVIYFTEILDGKILYTIGKILTFGTRDVDLFKFK